MKANDCLWTIEQLSNAISCFENIVLINPKTRNITDISIKELENTENNDVKTAIQNIWGISRIHISTDEIIAKSLFIGLQGNNVNGGEFFLTAFYNGANISIIDKCIDYSDKLDQISWSKISCPKLLMIVKDTYSNCLLQMARYRRNQSTAKIVAVTGSVGKTTTKEMIRHALNYIYPSKNIYASIGNKNSESGAPLMMVNMPLDIDYAIFEVGMSHKGEIYRITNILRPNICMITNIYPVHLEFFANLEEIAYAKAEIFDIIDIGMQENQIQYKGSKQCSWGILNASNDSYQLLSNIASRKSQCIIAVLDKNEADFVERYEIAYRTANVIISFHHNKKNASIDLRSLETTIHCMIEIEFIRNAHGDLQNLERYAISINLLHPSLSILYGACFACAAIIALENFHTNIMNDIGVADYSAIDNALGDLAKSFSIPSGRGNLQAFDKDGTKYMIINDAYNATFASMENALNTVEFYCETLQKAIDNMHPNDADTNISNKKVKIRKICILGDILELGNTSATTHEKLLNIATQKSLDRLYLVGNAMISALENIGETEPLKIITAETSDKMLEYIKRDLLINFHDSNNNFSEEICNTSYKQKEATKSKTIEISKNSHVVDDYLIILFKGSLGTKVYKIAEFVLNALQIKN